MSLFNRRFSSARKFLLHQLDDSEDESSNIEWELPTRRRFISLTQSDLLNTESFIAADMIQTKQSEVKIDALPLTIDNNEKKSDDEEISTQKSEEITKHNRYSLCSTKKKKIMDKTIQKIFEEQQKMRQEMEEKFKQFNEYKEIENMEKEIQKKHEHKLKKENELKEMEIIKEKERNESLDRLEKEKQIEIEKIKEVISQEFEKRNDDLMQKQNETEDLKNSMKEKIEDQNDLNISLKEKSEENEDLITNLKNKISELQLNEEETEQNKKEIHSAEMKQKEIIKEINDNQDLYERLQYEEKELKQNEIELIQQQNNLENERNKEITKRSKTAYKKFDIMRANIMMEAEIEFKHIRDKKSLLNLDDIMEMMKLKMRKQFKEQIMNLRLQINDDSANCMKMPYTKMNNSLFGDGDIVFAVSSNGEMCGCLGINGIFHVIDIRNGEDLYLGSMKRIICSYDENMIEDEILCVETEHIEWDKKSILCGVLLSHCKWMGIWDSLSKEFYELSVDDCDDIIATFAFSNNTLLFGMNNGDIYIKDMHKEGSSLIMIKHKMQNGIDICRWSEDHRFAITVNDTRIAIANDVGITLERIASKQMITDLKCGYINNNMLTIVSANTLMLHGINDTIKRKLMTFESGFGCIINHCWCNDSIIIAFEHGNVMVMNATTYENKLVECGECINDMDAIYLLDIGYIIVIIDATCIRFLKFIDDIAIEAQWTLIAVINYSNSKWMIVDEIPIKIRLTQNGKHSIVVTNKGTMVIYNLMM